MNTSETITIPLYEYEELQKDQAFLRALQDAGVYSWDGWKNALALYQKSPISMDVE
jgi:hypothetical protein